MTVPALREAARAIVLDPDDRVMLLRYDENGGFWATPGGSLEPGETHRQAVVRELREELGVQHVTLGPHLATRTKDHPVAGRNVRQAEHYYLARVQPENVLPQSAANPDNIQEWRWWTLAELAATSQTVYPAELTELLRDILASGPPPVPLTLKEPVGRFPRRLSPGRRCLSGPPGRHLPQQPAVAGQEIASRSRVAGPGRRRSGALLRGRVHAVPRARVTRHASWPFRSTLVGRGEVWLETGAGGAGAPGRCCLGALKMPVRPFTWRRPCRVSV